MFYSDDRQRLPVSSEEVPLLQSTQENKLPSKEYIDQGLKFYQQQKYSQAQICFKLAVDIDPSKSVHWDLLGLAALGSKQYQSSCQSFKTALSIEPNNVKYIERLGFSLAHLGKVEEAVMCYELGLQLAPDNPRFVLNLAQLWLQLGQQQKSLYYLRRSSPTGEWSAHGNTISGNLLSQNGYLQDAEKCLIKAINIDPTQPQIYVSYAHLLFKDRKNTQNIFKAIKCLQLSLTLSADNDRAYSNMGYAFSLLRREEEAAECYQKARQLAPRNQNYLRHWFEVMIRLGKGTEAMAQLLKQPEMDVRCMVMVAKELISKGKIEAALKYFKQAIAKQPDNVFLRKEYLQANNQQPGIKLLDDIIDQMPNGVTKIFFLGIKMMMTNELQRAEGCFREVLQEKSRMVSVYLNLSSTLVQQGRIEEAANCFALALQHGTTCTLAFLKVGCFLACYPQFIKQVYKTCLFIFESCPVHPKVIFNLSLFFSSHCQFQLSVQLFFYLLQLLGSQKEGVGWCLQQLRRNTELSITQSTTMISRLYRGILFFENGNQIKFMEQFSKLLENKKLSAKLKRLVAGLADKENALKIQNYLVKSKMLDSGAGFSNDFRDFTALADNFFASGKKNQDCFFQTICHRYQKRRRGSGWFRRSEGTQRTKTKTNIFFRAISVLLDPERTTLPSLAAGREANGQILRRIYTLSQKDKYLGLDVSSILKTCLLQVVIKMAEIKSTLSQPLQQHLGRDRPWEEWPIMESGYFGSEADGSEIESSVGRRKESQVSSDSELEHFVEACRDEDSLEEKVVVSANQVEKALPSSEADRLRIKSLRTFGRIFTTLKIPLSGEEIQRAMGMHDKGKPICTNIREQRFVMKSSRVEQESSISSISSSPERSRFSYKLNASSSNLASYSRSRSMSIHQDILPSLDSIDCFGAILCRQSVSLIGEMRREREEQYRDMLFKNHLHLISLISKKRHQLRYIAKHYLRNIRVNYQLNTYVSFQLLIEKGNPAFILHDHSSSDDLANYLWSRGEERVMLWVKCLLEGVLQLQQLGVFHADLQLRNTIQTRRNNRCVYKIIDFDYAFGVLSDDLAGRTTRQMVQFWINLPEEWMDEGYFIGYLFRGVQFASRSTYLELMRIKKSREVATEQKIERIMKMLKQYMYRSHKGQIEGLISRLNYTSKNSKLDFVAEMAAKIPIEPESANTTGYHELLKTIAQLYPNI